VGIAASADYSIYGLRYEANEWKWFNCPAHGAEWYVDEGKLFDLAAGAPNDDVNYYDVSQNCGTAAHKPGTADWGRHWHVYRSDYPTSLSGSYKQITKDEATKYYYGRIVGEGYWNSKYCPTKYPSSESATKTTDTNDADFKYNCHGYAFDKIGLSDFKLLWDDNASGAGKVVDGKCLAITPSIDGLDNRLMYMGTHSNWVKDDYACKPKTIQFKLRDSQVFKFTYSSPGRTVYQQWNGSDPAYYKKTP
jgi:hypothetical protein